MARLHIVIGYSEAKPTSDPFPVYVGRSGEEMRVAIAHSPYPMHEILTHAVGLRKNNPNAAANAAKLAAAPSEVAAPEAAPAAELPPSDLPPASDSAPRPGGRRR